MLIDFVEAILFRAPDEWGTDVWWKSTPWHTRPMNSAELINYATDIGRLESATWSGT